MKKKKNDRILIGILLIVFGGYLLATSILEKTGDIAYVKVRNTVLFSVDLRDGSFTPRKNEQVIMLEELPRVEKDGIYVNDIKLDTLEINKGIAVYENQYYIMGHLGIVVIEYKDSKVRVKEEFSPYNICSRQGFSDKNPIICLPNYVTIEFNQSETDVII